LEMVALIISGGVDTTTSLTGQALMWLDQHPDDRSALVEDAALLHLATEEFLRAFCPVTSLARTVLSDTEISGHRVRAGERIMLPWYAANRDPEVFPDPDEVQLDRFPNRHTSFGLGVHRCVGSNLARASFKSLLTGILRRLPDYQIDLAGSAFYPAIGINSGWSKLPATFTPGARSQPDGPLPMLAS
jgi:cytochrome P450